VQVDRSGKGELAEVSLVPIQELQYLFKKKNERIRKGPNDGQRRKSQLEMERAEGQNSEERGFTNEKIARLFCFFPFFFFLSEASIGSELLVHDVRLD
jgi:hypothetical protein